MNKYYITTSIPYVNAEPHIGFGMELVQADVLARYYRGLGGEVAFSTGTDEHGGKIEEKAKEKGVSPLEFATAISDSFRASCQRLNVTNDRFIRTTDEAHEQRAQIIWKNMAQYIYKDSYIGWYCTGDEAFFTESVVKENNGVCPAHNRPYEKIEEENYFFALSKFQEPIKEAILSESFKIRPVSRKNEILALLNEGLEDMSISRPKQKISWGIPVPGDDSHVMYVWFEALMNYITGLGYPEHGDMKKFWPATVQIVGKDISRFHAAVWPGMLLALGLPLPKMLYVHGFITVDGQKMSKTLGNVISPMQVIDRYGVDTFRYFFLRHIPSYGDGDFNLEVIDKVYNKELSNELGNAVQRTIVMIEKYQNGLIGTVIPVSHDTEPYHEAMAECRFDKALEEVWERVRGLNQYIDTEKPWVIAKSDDEQHLSEILSYMVGCLLEIALLLAPFMPDISEKITATFSEGIVRSSGTVLFPKLDEPAVTV